MIRVVDGLLALIFVFALLAFGCFAGRAYRAEAATQSGFEIRGVLESAASDGSGYFKLGEALILMTPPDSALLPGIRALDGKPVRVILEEVK